MRRRFSMRWMPLWVTDGMKVMPLLSEMKYGWHYSNADIGTLHLLRAELFLSPAERIPPEKRLFMPADSRPQV